MNFKTWIHGLGAAVVGGAANAITNLIVAPETFNLGAGWKKLVSCVIVSSILSAAFYLKQSPLPDDKSQTQNPT